VYESDRIDIDASDNRSDSILTVPDSGPFEEFQDDDLDFDSSDLDEITNVDAVIKSVWHWWKEILGLSLFITVIFNIMFLRPIIRFVRTDTVREMMRSFNIWLESQRGVSDIIKSVLNLKRLVVLTDASIKSAGSGRSS